MQNQYFARNNKVMIVQRVVTIIETPDFAMYIICNIYFIFSWIDL